MTNEPGTPVIHVASHYPPSLGGTEKVVWALALALRQQGWSVHVLTSRYSGSLGDGPRSPDYVKRLAAWNIAHTAIIPGLLRQLLRMPRGSVVHLHIAQAFVPEMVYAAHVLRGLPYVA